MRTYQTLLLGFLFAVSVNLQAEDTFMYRLYLKDKGVSPFSVENPEQFLSEKSIERRTKQGYSVDSSDLPYDPAYFGAIEATGAQIRTYSKWVNTVVVHVPDLSFLSELANLSFVDSLHRVWKGSLPSLDAAQGGNAVSLGNASTNLNSHGNSFMQINMNKGHLLHDLGFYGSGLSIAVIDGGFLNVDKIDFFDQTQIKEVKSFNHETSDPLQSSSEHGTRVLSCMLANKTGEMIGTAPLADYYLFRTEVTSDEFPVEEDYWIAALEYADSIGVDVVTSSLGYVSFDDSRMSHSYDQLDGKTIPISKAASMAASKGLLLFNSAGNEGNKSWGKIMFPSDAESVLTVGSVADDRSVSSFSSRGYTADGRVKPDVMAMGSAVTVVDSQGELISANGTSFATPIMAGLATCLWEALPGLTNVEIIQLIKETASSYLDPTLEMGYGIADVFKAYEKGKNDTGTSLIASGQYLRVSSQNNCLYVNLDVDFPYSEAFLSVYSGLGVQIMSVRNLSGSINVSSLPKGVYVAVLQLDKMKFVSKFVKM